jgi:hypothetical protein
MGGTPFHRDMLRRWQVEKWDRIIVQQYSVFHLKCTLRYAVYMTRDMDLMRAILIQVEKLPPLERWAAKPLDGYGVKEVVAHVQLAHDAGLAEAKFVPGAAMILRITNDGYDFLEASKQPTLWQQAKDQLVSQGLPITVATIRAVLQGLIQHQLAKLGIA